MIIIRHKITPLSQAPKLMNPQTKNIPVVLTIAGSDSGGGAGIQADIKTISATGSYACSVITAVTAQNTRGVDAVYPLPADIIAQQLESVFSDLNIIAVKIGMLSRPEIIQIVAKSLSRYQPRWLVIDPVMISSSGTFLLEPSAVELLKATLLPMADLITPNLPEAAELFGQVPAFSRSSMNQTATDIRQAGYQAVLLKGGHAENKHVSEDWLITREQILKFEAKRITAKNTHGTGCTLSSAIASFLAQGDNLSDAVHKAKQFISQAILAADELNVGHGNGPVHHFHAFY